MSALLLSLLVGADIFFDDQHKHCESSRQHVDTNHVPHGVANEGVEAYCRYQVEREEISLELGVAFSLMKKLLVLNEHDPSNLVLR